MKQTRLLMGMPITVEIIAEAAPQVLIDKVYDFFRLIDNRFSTYKPTSEISQINRGLSRNKWSQQMKHVMDLCEQTKQQTGGYFDIKHSGQLDPSGLVKGWAILGAAELLKRHHTHNFYIDAGGDIQVSGLNEEGKAWTVGIRNPFNRNEIVKTIATSQEGIATSGTAIRGQHIYNPHNAYIANPVVSLTVIGPDIYEADRLATAAFAMGTAGIDFIEQLEGFEGYMITNDQMATLTTGFEKYALVHA